MNIETEVRSFISKEKFDKLLDFFKQNAELIKEDSQETSYFDCDEDLRIQKNDFFAKIWMKKGKLHDDSREEIEIKFDKSEFENLEKLFLALKYNTEIKWFRKRSQFKWDDITVCLDYTKGYGHIIELEKMCTEETKEREFEILKQKLQSLGVNISSKEEFNQKFQYYKENWRSLI
ncbi:CYTH domain-containing protein [archaeon]|jgi:predicted adenylyl cyclase CyaB|nr:CYTH domain-containing protein [archaeon]MBT3577407.1 CYTH domain-containing protein [archaeon]MBT6820350.1 CYTH domain-containing protein [archaeon]MBT6956099.1 CYTH domain-containing protein [archaeon]MBT7025164.1 CYTH domain-containing protein [archaeon]